MSLERRKASAVSSAFHSRQFLIVAVRDGGNHSPFWRSDESWNAVGCHTKTARANDKRSEI